MNQFLSAAQRHLESSAALPVVLQRVAGEAVPALADFCLIFLAKGKEIPCVASAHSTADGERLLRRLNRVYRITRKDPISTVAHVLRSGRPQLRSEIALEPNQPRAGVGVFTLHQRLGARSVLVVPIGTRPYVVGAVSLAYAHSQRQYSSHDVPVARRLGAMIAAFLRERAHPRRASIPLPVGRRSIRLRARV